MGYIKTATMRQALRMGLAVDKYTGEAVLKERQLRNRRR
jgi:hypothetical protein